MCRMVLQKMFQCDLPKARPGWLRVDGAKQPLELDGYNERLNIAFEYQGGQHYEVSRRDHRFGVADVARIRFNDAEKRRRCWDRKVALVIVPEVLTLNDIDRFINQVEFSVTGAGLNIPDTWKSGRPKALGDIWEPDRKPITEEMRDVAFGRGGKCLSETFIKVDDNLEWSCAKGHVWDAPWSRVKKGSWCRFCKASSGRLKRRNPTHISGAYPYGNGRWLSSVTEGIGRTKKTKRLGVFQTQEEAHEAWLNYKRGRC